jgi:hypothetical protein
MPYVDSAVIEFSEALNASPPPWKELLLLNAQQLFYSEAMSASDLWVYYGRHHRGIVVWLRSLSEQEADAVAKALRDPESVRRFALKRDVCESLEDAGLHEDSDPVWLYLSSEAFRWLQQIFNRERA